MTANQNLFLGEFSRHSYISKDEAPVKRKCPERHMYYVCIVCRVVTSLPRIHGMLYSPGQEVGHKTKEEDTLYLRIAGR